MSSHAPSQILNFSLFSHYFLQWLPKFAVVACSCLVPWDECIAWHHSEHPYYHYFSSGYTYSCFKMPMQSKPREHTMPDNNEEVQREVEGKQFVDNLEKNQLWSWLKPVLLPPACSCMQNLLPWLHSILINWSLAQTASQASLGFGPGWTFGGGCG